MNNRPTSSGTVARVAKLLSVLAEADGPASLSDIANRMSLPASTTHRLLNLLVAQGFVEQDASTKNYRVGLELFRIGSLVASKMELPEIAEKFMREVVDSCDETCMLSLREAKSHSFTIAKVIYGSHPLRYDVKLFERSSLVWGAPGRGILAFLPEEDIEAALAAEAARPQHIPGREISSVRADLAETRRRGYAFTHGQNVPGAVGISAPIANADGVIGALCVTMPESRFTNDLHEKVAKVVTTQASRLSSMLGR